MVAKHIRDLVEADLAERERVGIETYGQPLTTRTAIDPLRYLYEELLDAAMYVRMELEQQGR